LSPDPEISLKDGKNSKKVEEEKKM